MSRRIVASEVSNGTGELLDGAFVVVVFGQVGNCDGPSSSEGQVLGRHEPCLSDIDKVLVFPEDEEECPSWGQRYVFRVLLTNQDQRDEKVRNVANLPVWSDITKRKLVQTSLSSIGLGSSNMSEYNVRWSMSTYETGKQTAILRITYGTSIWTPKTFKYLTNKYASGPLATIISWSGV